MKWLISLLIIMIATVSLLTNCSVTENCKSVNYGIKSENVSTYIIKDNDTLLSAGYSSFYNTYGLLEKDIYYQESYEDTSTTLIKYNDQRADRMVVYSTGIKDTTVLIATEWNKNDMATKFIGKNGMGYCWEYEYEDCKRTCKKTYKNDELIFSTNFIWEDQLMVQMSTNFHGDFSKEVGKTTEKTKFTYYTFDSKNNWSTRTYTNEIGTFLEIRHLEYY